MKTRIKQIFFVLVLVSVAMALPTPCQSATAEEIKAEMRRIDEQVTRIDREIAAMKKDVNLLQRAHDKMQAAIQDPKMYPVRDGGSDQFPTYSFYTEADLSEIAAHKAIHDLIQYRLNKNYGRMSYEEWLERLKDSSMYERERLKKQYLQRYREWILEIKNDIVQQEREKKRLVERFNVLANTKPETKSQVTGIPIEPPTTWRECEDSNVRICGTWTYNDDNQTFSAVWDNGAKATLKLTKFDSQGVRIRRDDKSGSSKGLQAEYTGKITPTGIADGKVTWVWGGRSWSGTWSVTW